jgi:hypothetical protein
VITGKEVELSAGWRPPLLWRVMEKRSPEMQER